MSSYSNLPHPYGVLPSGNAMLVTNPHGVRRQGLGLLSCIADAALLELLSFLEAEELARFMLLSRVTYVYTNHIDLWRDLTLKRWNGNVEFITTWRDTFARMMVKDSGDMELWRSFQPHTPIRVAKVFSDVLHRVWACHTCNLEQACPGFYKHNDIDCCDAGDLSVDRFIDDYEMKNRPLIIKNAINHWPSMQKWNPGYLSQACGDRKFRATSATAPMAANFTMEEYFAYAAQTREEAALYLFDRDFHAVAELGDDYDVPAYFNPTIAVRSSPPSGSSTTHSESGGGSSDGSNSNSNSNNNSSSSNNSNNSNNIDNSNKNNNNGDSSNSSGSVNNSSKSASNGTSIDINTTHSQSNHTFATDLFRVFGDARPDYRWLIAGPRRSGSIFHIDPNNTNAWNVCIKGRKKWIFYPPGVSPPGVVSSPDGADVTVPLSTGEWLLSFWAAHLVARKHADPKRRPLEAVVEEGEVIFVPHGYWHMVVNLDDCIAVTHNYVSSSNLADVLRFLREKPDQISGVRDRAEQGAVQPEAIYGQFLGRLSSVLSAEAITLVVAESKRSRGCLMPKKSTTAYATHIVKENVCMNGAGNNEAKTRTGAVQDGPVDSSADSHSDASEGCADTASESRATPAFSFSFF